MWLDPLFIQHFDKSRLGPSALQDTSFHCCLPLLALLQISIHHINLINVSIFHFMWCLSLHWTSLAFTVSFRHSCALPSWWGDLEMGACPAMAALGPGTSWAAGAVHSPNPALPLGCSGPHRAQRFTEALSSKPEVMAFPSWYSVNWCTEKIKTCTKSLSFACGMTSSNCSVCISG